MSCMESTQYTPENVERVFTDRFERQLATLTTRGRLSEAEADKLFATFTDAMSQVSEAIQTASNYKPLVVDQAPVPRSFE